MKKHCCLEPHATTGHSLYYRPDIPPLERTSTSIGWRTRQFYTNEKNDCRDWMLELELWGVKVVLALGAFEVGGIFVALF